MTLGEAHTERTLADEASAALRELESVPISAQLVGDAANELERAWLRRPFVIGVGGDIAARTALFGALSGGMPIDATVRLGGGPALRLRRGKSARCVAIGDAGELGEVTMPMPEDDPKLREEVELARTAVADMQLLAREAEAHIPPLVRTRPKPWAIWLWPVRWWLIRSKRAVVDIWRRAVARYEEAERTAAAAEARLAGHEDHHHGIRSGYGERIQRWLGQRGVRELVIEIDRGSWPTGVELLELGGDAEVDAVLITDGKEIHAGASGTTQRLGTPAELAQHALPLAAVARTLRLTRRAVERLSLVIKTLDTERARTERGFAERLEKIEAMRIGDPDTFAQTSIANVRPQIIASTNAVMEHAGTHLGAALAELGTAWTTAIAAATSNDELKAAVAKLDEESIAAAKQIADDIRVLVTGGAAGIAYDLLRAVLAPVTGESDSGARRKAPDLPQLALLPSLTKGMSAQLAAGESWFSGLFRSFETRRLDIHNKATARIAHLREVAEAELLDVEPRLHAAITDALAGELTRELARQAEWIETELRRERFAVAGERGALLPLERALSAARRYHDGLVDRVTRLETQDPVAGLASR